MKYPVLYNSTETNFENNGIGVLSDCISCEVTEDESYEFFLTLKYPIDGLFYSAIQTRMILKAKPDHYREPQLFRINNITKPMQGIVTISAFHISYDLNGMPLRFHYPSFITDGTPADVFESMKRVSVVDVPFVFWTDIEKTSIISSGEGNINFRSILFSKAMNSILSRFGGEYEFDNFVVKLHKERGQHRGVTIRYGKNLVDFVQDENVDNLYTGVLPCWKGDDEDGNYHSVYLEESIVEVEGDFDFVRILPLDLSNVDMETENTVPTEDEIRAYTNQYIKNNKIGKPSISVKMTIEELANSSEYESIESLERISLYDYINVEYPRFGISMEAKVVKTVYDVLLEKMKSITIGTPKKTIIDTLAKR